MSKKKALVVFSGGQDSTTCLFWAIAQGYEVHALTFNYNQRHQEELYAARRVLSYAQEAMAQHFDHEVLNVGPGVLTGTSPLVSLNVLEQYEDKDSLPGGIEKTFVPLRNQFFLTVAANRAVCIGAEVLVTGVCQEDFGGYPDCRRVFIDALETAINLGGEGAHKPIEIHTPLMYLTKAESVKLAINLQKEGFPAYAALAFSHTAYDGKYPPTGKDHASLLREKGFFEAGVPDPLVLRAVEEAKMAKPLASNYSVEALWLVQKLLPACCLP